MERMTLAQSTTDRNYPELPCSVNTRIEVDDLCMQVTGRGYTPAEAVSNLHETLAALRPLPSTPPIAAQIATLLACGLGKATAAQDWPLVERLSKAAALVLADACELGDRPGLVCVRSQANPETWYEVESGHCSCPDGLRHQERACKHRLAAAMWQRLKA